MPPFFCQPFFPITYFLSLSRSADSTVLCAAISSSWTFIRSSCSLKESVFTPGAKAGLSTRRENRLERAGPCLTDSQIRTRMNYLTKDCKRMPGSLSCLPELRYVEMLFLLEYINIRFKGKKARFDQRVQLRALTSPERKGPSRPNTGPPFVPLYRKDDVLDSVDSVGLEVATFILRKQSEVFRFNAILCG